MLANQGLGGHRTINTLDVINAKCVPTAWNRNGDNYYRD